MDDKRKTIDLLPNYLRSETLRKMFSATVDQLFQPESVEFISGYAGIKPPWYIPSKDFYIQEPDKNRQDYQLTPTAVSVNFQSGRLTNALFYDDLVNQLRFQGAITTNHSRLFEQEYYSWCPPIDIDKFVNFTKYFWLPSGPSPIELLDTTDFVNQVQGKQNYTYSGWVRYRSTGQTANVTLDFTSGLVVVPTADRNIAYNQEVFVIEGVGKSIVLIEIPPTSNPGWDTVGWDLDSWDSAQEYTDKQYITISRASQDENQWSLTNRWFHDDILKVSKTQISDITSFQSRRPIIEFLPNIELYKYGIHSRGIIDIVDTTTPDLLGSIVGQSSYTIDFIPLRDGMRIMGISSTLKQQFPNEYGRIYIVSGVSEGNIELTLDTSGTSGNGSPVFGDRASVNFGALQGYNIYYNGSTWVTNGQQIVPGVPPQFVLYDYNGNMLDDPVVYPSSTFNGSPVFSYTTDTNSTIDTELGINAKLDQYGDFVFTNNLISTTISYISDGKTVNYVGNLFAKVGDYYSNAWNTAPEPSRQYIINEFLADGEEKTYEIDQEPANQLANTLPTIFVSLITENNEEIICQKNVDYVVIENQVTFTVAPRNNTRIIIKSWSKETPTLIKGFYEIPKNLSANPNNEDISVISRSQFLGQFLEIINNQTGFTGSALGNNNYRDTSQNLGLGLSILQHRAPLLKLSVMNSTALEDISSINSAIDPMLAMQNAQRSYQRFYNRFLLTLFAQVKKLGGNQSPSGCDPTFINQLVTSTLKQINIGKTVDSPWTNSGPDGISGSYCSQQAQNPSWVPATATRLGITPAYQPIVYMDTSYTTPKLVIQCHDGSRIVMVNEQGEQLGTFVHGQNSTTNPEELTDPVAAAWLQFELNLFNNLPNAYKNSQANYVFPVTSYMPGKWRNTDYTRPEVIKLQRGSFDKWTISNQINYQANTGYQTTDQFSYNYRSVVDNDGYPVPGHWQGIYRWFYDTDRPHTHPWEMLGFSQMPEWWESEYGPAPYTNGNLALWQDLRDGYIRQGPRQGYYYQWSRPGLLSCIPVDDQGNLLPPYQAGCVSSLPDVYSARSEWIFGDGSPVESVWINSQEYPFILAQVGYLMKPARFIEYTWDSLRTQEIYANTANKQWLYVDTYSRRASNQFYVHRESPINLSIGITIPEESNLTYFGSCGFQHWVSEYLYTQGLNVTSYFGNLIRGGNVQLAHRMAGFINSDTVRTMVDSFGDIGYQSQIIPNDNLKTFLYRSTSIGEAIYSGVMIEQVKEGYKVYGYDTINQRFIIIPSNVNGPQTTVLVGNKRAIEYLSGMNETQEVLYGSILPTRQAVFDFLISYGRWLTSQGWVFEQFNADSNAVFDWSQSAKEFLFWSQGDWQNGTFITVSPSADEMKFEKKYGNIQFISGLFSGTYPIVDRSGILIQPQNFTTIRDDGSLRVKPDNEQGIFGLKLYRTTIESAIFWDNLTGFGDIIYQPLFDLRQQRIKIYAYRANDWNGRLDAPGFILTKNNNTNTWSMVPNYDNTANQFTQYFNIEQPKNFDLITNDNLVMKMSTELGAVARQDIQNLSRHLLGYQNRLYLQNLLLEDAIEFEFYQGFIRNKGTQTVINRLLRNTSIIPETSTFEYYEEWMMRNSWYGAVNLNNIIEFRLPQSQVTSNPQWIRLFSTSDIDPVNDDVLEIVPNDPIIVVPPESYQDKLFTLRTSYKPDVKTDLPLAGYVQLGETTYTVGNTSELFSLYNDRLSTTTPLQINDTVWQFTTDTGSWTSWVLVKALGQISNTLPSSTTGGPTVITTTSEHGLTDGDIIIIYGVSGVDLLNGTYVVSNVTPLTFQIDVSTFEPGVGGTILVYRPTRFSTIFERDSGTPPGGWPENILTYVDEGGQVEGAWTVYKYTNNNFISYRQQEYIINSSLVGNSKLYNIDTGSEVSVVTYWDPAQGRISGKADTEITYKTDFDPAKYNRGSSDNYAVSESEAWSSAQVGQVWWDLSTVRYIDYEQGDDRYRIQHWGKIASGTSVDVYEWIRTTISPTDWANAVASGESITENGRSYIPSGSVRNPDNPNWSEVTEYGPGNTAVIYYYYWVKNSIMSPGVPTRKLTTLNISRLIQDPSIDDLPWFAAISSRSIILGNVKRLLNSDKIVQRITYSSQPNNLNNYNQWQLIRQGDPTSPITDNAWQKLKASLVTFDGLGNDVPDYRLPSSQKYGTTIRPRQTWFINRVAASSLFVNTFNDILSSRVTPFVDDPNVVGWEAYFTMAEPYPPESEYDYFVSSLIERDSLLGAITNNQVVLVAPTAVTNNLWTMWKFISFDNTWELIQRQNYNTNNYWQYVDWYFTGYSSNTIITQTVQTTSDLENVTPTTNAVIKVLNNGNNKWQLYTWTGKWSLVGQQDGSIQVLSTVYDWQVTPGGFDSAPFAEVAFDSNASIEFANIIDGIKNVIFSAPNSLELNTLFFAMINYVPSEQLQVDWLLKTSDIILKGFNQPLEQTQLLQADTVDSILGFINEAKPYHVKIREFVTGKSKTDIANASIVDFDRPPGSPYVIEPDVDSADYSYYQAYQSWLNNYQTNGELVRNLATTIIFDRISTPELSPAWSYIWNTNVWEGGEGSTNGAIDRINSYYEPTAGMIPKIISELLSGAAYKGTRLQSFGFNFDIGWDNNEWNAITWNANSVDIENYLDQIIQGGAIPVYDTAVGNGIVTEFPLTKNVSNPNEIVVWSDNSLRVYGLDYYIPTYALSVQIINGGINYNVGDFLDVPAGNKIAATRLRVTSVQSGVVTGLEILGKGSYITVLPGPYTTEYPTLYPGLGSGLLLSIDWSCDFIRFMSPPISSAVPNVYVLYIGQTFGAAPTEESDTIYDGNEFIQPFVDDNHPEELYLFKARDSVLIDTITSKQGGRPLVSSRVYITDGVNSQFDLGITPQNNESVQVYLAGSLLEEGYLNDYVINYDSNRVVFVSTPTIGQKLQIFVISTGGGSRSIASAYTVNPGYGYIPGSAINLDTSMGAISGILEVSTVKLSNMYIEESWDMDGWDMEAFDSALNGSGYIVGDLLYLNEGSGTIVDGNLTILKVTEIDDFGGILSLEIQNPGNWSALPATNSFSMNRETPNTFVDASITLSWGVNTVSVNSPGLYARMPAQPITQQSSSEGTGATFNVKFTSTLQTYRYTGDGVETDFTVPGLTATIPQGVFCTIDGVNTPILTRIADGVRFASAPVYGATVIITTFSSPEYSVVTNTNIVITNPAQLTYTVDSEPRSTLPNYLTTIVTVNDQLITPPLMQQWVGDNSTVTFPITIDLTGALSTDVYVDQILTTAYSIVGANITFTFAPKSNADIQMVVIKTGTNYTIIGDQITFNSGILLLNDEVQISTYPQDIDYEYHMEEFAYDPTGIYNLTKSSYDPATIRVWVDGTLQTQGIDYTVSPGQNSIIDPAAVIKFNPDVHTGTVVVVNYMHSIPYRPSLAWRTLVYENTTKTTVLDFSRVTNLLSNVLTTSETIEIENYNAISFTNGQLGYVYINNELISFNSLVLAPTMTYPNRALLSGLGRNRLGTSGNPQSTYNAIYYNGDSSTVYFACEGPGVALAESVFVDGNIQINYDIDPDNADYEFVIDPPSLPAGRYVHFMKSAPNIGYKNIKIASLISNGTNLCHPISSVVRDAGSEVTPPMPYTWEASPNGFQYSRTTQSEFYQSHPYEP
jgi:hypothetical protein